LRISQFLQTLPFWPRIRPDYFTHGVTDGKSAALSSGISLPADNARVGEQATFAAAALPGRVDPEDARIYRMGWIEGYQAAGKRIAPTGQL
jgi:hypothetical protein